MGGPNTTLNKLLTMSKHTLGEPKHWKGPAPRPDPEFIARPYGMIQWQCPDCGHLHCRNQVFWRRGQVRCGYVGCRHRFRVGLGFSDSEGVLRCLNMGKWKYNLANRVNPSSQYSPYHPVGNFSGSLDWICPKCNALKIDSVDFKFPVIICKSCNLTWLVQLLIYSPSGSKNITPLDWALPNVSETTNSTPPQTLGKS